MNTLAHILRRLPINNFNRRRLYLSLVRLFARWGELGWRIGF